MARLTRTYPTDEPYEIELVGTHLAELTTIGASRWVQLTCTTCGKSTSFTNPQPERMDWYTSSHRCGPLGSAWQREEGR